jgi:hypothetical protein
MPDIAAPMDRSMGVRRLAAPFLALLLSFFPAPAGAFDTSLFVDPEDGMFDASRYLSERRFSFLPVPVIITEPAVGLGFGVVGVFFHESPEQREAAARQAERGEFRPILPENVSAVAAAATDNGTWFAGGGHLGFWKNDSIRYAGFGMYGSFDLDFYSLGEIPLPRPVELQIAGPVIFQQIKWRLGASRWFLGARQVYAAMETSLVRSNPADSQIPPAAEGIVDEVFNRTIVNSGLGVVIDYDSRNNPFNPEQGAFYHANYISFDSALGSDVDYGAYQLKGLNYWRLPRNFGLNLRVQYDGIDAPQDERLPVYVPPYIQLRGIPAVRYQGRAVAVVEVEGTWTFRQRWKFSLFSGTGRAAESFSALSDAGNQSTVGVGFRYLLARRYGIAMGLDVARGPEDTALYIQAGPAW